MIIPRWRWLLGVLGAVWLLCNPAANAAGPCNDPVGRVVSAEGVVDVRRSAAGDWRRADAETLLCAGDMIRVGDNGRAAVSFFNDGVIRLDQNSSLRLLTETSQQRTFLELLSGAINFFSRRPRSLQVDTPYVNAAAEGTEFAVLVGGGRTEIVVFEGRVVAANDQGRLELGNGEAGVATAGTAPSRMVVVRPADAVQWALYYPPILALPPEEPGQGQGQLIAQSHVRRAAALLNVGRVAEAEAAAEAALAADPSAGLAWSLRAVIAVAANDRARALTAARQGVALAPDAAAAKIALSYALQADQRLEEARDVLQAAVEQSPGDGLAWARLAEIRLALGARQEALAAARTAETLAPTLGRVQTVLGFAALTAFRYDDAALAFRRAAVLDAADPLPRLGLGLAKIRGGDLEEGRRELEIAAGLDPGDSLVRSYLGKAYFEERRDAFAARELERAKELDPLDPTPHLYDAIRKQTENRPVEALRDIERSIALNDNRAVYRGRLLLDKDRAARGASLGRIYEDLGFQQLGVNEAAWSLALAPSDASAHRFLADLNRTRPRHELARVSELLKSQLLQDININPIQPSFLETDLNVISRGGPGSPGLNEYTPLFERNEAHLALSTVAGSNRRWGGEAIASGVYDGLSASGGHFHLQDDGFRDNNDFAVDLSTVFAQVAVTPNASVQVEARRERRDQGDLILNFDPADYRPDFRQEIEQDNVRLGGRLSFAPGSDLLASVAYGRRENRLEDLPSFQDDVIEDEGYQGEMQYIVSGDKYNLSVGGGLYDVDVTERFQLDGITSKPDVTHQTVYAYGNATPFDDVVVTLGLSWASFRQERDGEEEIDVDGLDPKLGVQWNVTDRLRLRAAYLETVKRPLVIEQTLEPTQVAGFNQFYDDLDGSESRRYGVGLDVRLLDDLYAGAEASRRTIDIPILTPAGFPTIQETWEEDLYAGYVYWTPGDRWAVRAAVEAETFERPETTFLGFSFPFPGSVETVMVPVSVNYFHPSGWFAGAKGTFVDQTVDISSFSAYPEDSDSFFLVDAVIGYRLPKRLGIVSVEGRNLLNQQFRFQDDSFRSSTRIGPMFVPETTVQARLTLNF
ncbi:MAG: TonB-dependent receptor [Rhodospirillales bacterium]|nr:TonB-dependent receptor [Rhodospirillales bacterium]